MQQVYFYSRASSTGERERKRVSASLDWSNEHPQVRMRPRVLLRYA